MSTSSQLPSCFYVVFFSKNLIFSFFFVFNFPFHSTNLLSIVLTHFKSSDLFSTVRNFNPTLWWSGHWRIFFYFIFSTIQLFPKLLFFSLGKINISYLFCFFTFFHLFILCFFYFFFSALCGIFVHCTHTNTILLFTPPPLALVLRSDAVAAAVAVFRVPPVAADHVKINLFLFVYPSVLILTNNKKNWFLFPTFLIIIFSSTNHYTTYYSVNAILIYFLLFILFRSIGKTKQLNSTNPLQIHI